MILNKEIGYFNDINRTYGIEEMFPRRRLTNYLWNEDFIAATDQFGNGRSLYMGVDGNVTFLCLWGGGDWNDSINNVGMQLKGESVWLLQIAERVLCQFRLYKPDTSNTERN